MTKRRRPLPRTHIRLAATSREMARLQAIAEQACATQPQTARAFAGILASFVATTGPARRRATRPRIETKRGEAAAPSSSRRIVVLGGVSLVVALMASLAAGAVVFPPPRASYDVARATALEFSAVAAGLATLFTLLGSVLPGWGEPEMRKQAWQLHIVGAVVLMAGLVYVALRVRLAPADFSEVGVTLWWTWFVANVLALAAGVLGAVVRRRRARVGSAPTVGHDIDAKYLSAISAAKAQAVAQLDALVAAHPSESALVEREWKAALEKVRRGHTLSAATLENTRAMSAFRWRLELAAEPDFDPDRGVG